MISAANLRQPLSGSNLLLIVFLFVLLAGCATRKQKNATVIKKDPPVQKQNPLPKKIDTVVWKIEDPIKSSVEQTNPSKANEKKSESNRFNKKYKKSNDQLEVVLLFPFKCNFLDSSTTKINTASIRYVQYYAGMLMAVDELNKETDKKINIQVFDCESLEEVSQVLEKFNKIPPHLIIGPQKVEALKYAAEWAKAHETTLFSPWVSSSTITNDNPYYIQGKAGLNAHYEILNAHARAHYPKENIVLISKSLDDSKARFFNEGISPKDTIAEVFLKEADLMTGIDPIIAPLFRNSGPTVFILPYASAKDENYVYHFIRRATSEKGNKEMVIYGTYKWLEMKSDILDFMNVYNIRISIGNIFDQDNALVKSFRRRYYDRFREFPSQDALEGYDMAKYSLKSLRTYGEDFQWKGMNSFSGLLENSFNLLPVYKSKDSKLEEDYYENSNLKIVEIKNNRYRVIE